MSSYQNLILNYPGHAHIEIVLNRPEKRNALNSVLVAELKKVFCEINVNKKIKTISLKGQDKAFCSGADLEHLKKMQKFSYDENLADSLELAQLYLQIYRLNKPVIAIVEGPALAGGCGLASICDFVLASEKAKFGYPEVRIGFIAALVSVFLTRQVGERVARELLLTGKIITAEKALSIGLINAIYGTDKMNQAERDLIEILQNNSALAMQHTKSLFIKDIEREINDLARENAKFRETADFTEGISSFIEKRKPKWSVS